MAARKRTLGHFAPVLLTVLGSMMSAAQDAPVPTLHVYANLIQIPSLVLSWHGEALRKPLDAKRFYVRVDSGPWFRATHVRLEEDDPITLGILLDARGDVESLMPKVEEAIARMPLHPRDHVSIYALDCKLTRSMDDAPAEPGMLKAGVEQALQPWADRKKEKHRDGCKDPAHLWDALNYAVRRMNGHPGRHVILAVSDGDDMGSVHTWKDLAVSAEGEGRRHLRDDLSG